MVTIFKDYEELVIKDYHQKKKEKCLPLNLSQPTPARLKEECLRVCKGRFLKKDEPVILDFFGEGGNQKECLQVIELCKIDKFKPLLNFLNGDTTKTDEKNIFLLAWLIDYPDRPFDPIKDYKPPKMPYSEPKGEDNTPGKVDDLTKRPKIQETQPITGDVVGNSGSQKDPSQGSSGKEVELSAGAVAEIPNPVEQGTFFGVNTEIVAGERASDGIIEREPVLDQAGSALRLLPSWRYWNACVAGTLLLVAGMAGFWSLDGREPAIWAGTNGSCMYWADDHYQPIPCNQKMLNKRLVALDTTLVKNFRKITQPDTITYRAKGWVWYSKINNRVEFFTSGGEHPVVYGRPLRPITDYMIDKYIKQGMTSNP